MYSPIEATLLCISTEQNDNGYDEIVVLKRTEVFVILKSVSHAEYYRALEVGINPTKIAVMYVHEYEESFIDGKAPSHMLIDDVLYKIVREYQTDIDHTQLTLEKDNRNEVSI